MVTLLKVLMTLASLVFVGMIASGFFLGGGLSVFGLVMLTSTLLGHFALYMPVGLGRISSDG